MRRAPFGSMLMLFLAGCQGDMSRFRCVTWDELDLTDPAGGAPADVFAEVRAAIDQFAAWSARDGLCVEEVRLVEEIVSEDDVVGQYGGAVVQVEYGTPHPEETVFHELCHAADAQAGWVSEAWPEWFGTEEPHEDFARRCADGPRPVSQLEALEAACGEDLLAGRQRLFNEEVFGAADVLEEPAAGTLAIALDRRPIVGLPEDIDWAAYAGGTAVYQTAFARDGEGVLWVDLVQVDVATAAVRVIDGPALPDGRDADVFSSDAGPLLVLEGEPRAWQVDEAAGVFVEVEFAPFDDVTGGAVLDGFAWVLGTAEGEAEPTFSHVDLATGAREVRALPAGLTEWDLSAQGRGLGGIARYEAEGRYWLAYDVEADTWSRSRGPAGWYGSQRSTLPDGRLVATWDDIVGANPYLFSALAVVDPAAGTWWTADAPCADDAVNLNLQLLSVGGVPYLWEYPSGWGGSRVADAEGHALTRVDVP